MFHSCRENVEVEVKHQNKMVVSSAVCSKGCGSVVVDSLLLLLSLNVVLFYVWPLFCNTIHSVLQLAEEERA